MHNQTNPKVVGAFVIGFALVAGAYTISNFGKSTYVPSQQGANAISSAPLRVAIDVEDADNNGIEDWRDAFVTTEPVLINTTASSSDDYTPPDTITGKLGINFVQNIVRAKGYGAFGPSEEEVIGTTIKDLERQTSFLIYDTPDILIMEEWNEGDIRTYGNALASAITRNSNADLEHELTILQDILNRNDRSRLSELEKLTEVYAKTIQDTLVVPVPRIFVKQHLDLINTYLAVQKDIEAMTLSFDDPAYSLLRLKRYEDDTKGLYLALQNIYKALEPYAGLFTANDSAVLFILFSPTNQNRI